MAGHGRPWPALFFQTVVQHGRSLFGRFRSKPTTEKSPERDPCTAPGSSTAEQQGFSFLDDVKTLHWRLFEEDGAVPGYRYSHERTLEELRGFIADWRGRL